MKVVCVADAFITSKMMYDGIGSLLGPGDEMEVFFFGLPDVTEMRDVVKALEAGKRREIAVPEGLYEAVVDADLMVVHQCPVNEELFAHAPRLKAVMSCRGGTENIAIDEATRHGVIVSNNPAHNANAVAEYTVGLMLAETRNIVRSDKALREGIWRRTYPNSKAEIREMADMTVGIVGYGTIGRLVARKLSSFGCRILAYDLFINESEDFVTMVSLDELLRESDIVTLHARSDRALIGEKDFAMMKDNAYLINTARSYLVDSNAFQKAMDSGKLIGAAIDVFEKEPEIPGFYRKYDNITITSHRGGDTINSYKDAPKFAISNYLSFLNGEPLKFWVNKKELSA